jgi:hypothetical protein
MSNTHICTAIVMVLCVIGTASECHGQEEESSKEELMVREAGNPLTSVINLPIQDNVRFGIGEYDRTMHIIKIQPVRLSTSAGRIYRIRSRSIIPLIYAPDISSPTGGTFGLGDIAVTGFFSPRRLGRFIWGLGPIISFPTATDSKLGTGKWSAGPSLVLASQCRSWLAGFIVFNIWSFAGSSGRDDVNRMQIDVLFRYHLGNRWLLVSSPTIEANWKVSDGNQWLVPVGGGIGRIWQIGGNGIGVEFQAFYNAIYPESLPFPDWTIRFQVQFVGRLRR